MQTMTPQAIREAFQKLRDGREMKAVADAARCRSESDWLIGINGTRAITKRMFGSRGGQRRVGRPRANAHARDRLRARAGDPEFQTARLLARDGDVRDREGHIRRRLSAARISRERRTTSTIASIASGIEPMAEAVVAACQGQPLAEVSEEKKASTQAAPRLYDLTTLQREANNRFGFSAAPHPADRAGALRDAQDASPIRGPIRARCRRIISRPCGKRSAILRAISRKRTRDKVLENGWVRPNKRIFNNAQISRSLRDHPHDLTRRRHLDEMEAKIFDMIARRFVAAFYPGGGIRRHDAHQHSRAGTRFQDGRQSADRARLAGGLRQDHGRDDSPRVKALPALSAEDNAARPKTRRS